MISQNVSRAFILADNDILTLLAFAIKGLKKRDDENIDNNKDNDKGKDEEDSELTKGGKIMDYKVQEQEQEQQNQEEEQKQNMEPETTEKTEGKNNRPTDTPTNQLTGWTDQS